MLADHAEVDGRAVLMEHTLVPRLSKEEAASAAYRNSRLACYEKVKKLHKQGMSMMAIALWG